MAPCPARPPGSQLATLTAPPLFLALWVWQHISMFAHRHCQAPPVPSSSCPTLGLHRKPAWAILGAGEPRPCTVFTSPSPLSLCPPLAAQLASARSALPGKSNSTVRGLFTLCLYLRDIFHQHPNPTKHHGATSILCCSLPTNFSL